jgi:prolyl-tRNA synthetase
MAAVVESSFDENGIIWPVSVAPYEVAITVVRADDEATVAAAETLYGQLQAAGIEVLLDDRIERPGVKFADSELIGIPYRITIGPRGVESGTVETLTRRGMEKDEMPIAEVSDWLIDLVEGQRSGL